MTDTVITITGNVGWDPNRRVLASGHVVTDFRVATTPRRLDKTTGDWRDLETMWFTVSCWRQLAENVATSIRKGDRVVVTGRLSVSSWVGKEGEPRVTHQVDATAVGFELSRVPVTAHRVERAQAAEPVEDPWTAEPEQVDPVTGELIGAVPEQTAA